MNNNEPPVSRGLQLRHEMGLISVDELEEMLDVKASTLEYWRNSSQGPDYTKLGRVIFYRRSDVEAWIALNVVPTKRTGTNG